MRWTWCMKRGIAVLAIIVLALLAGIFGCSWRADPAPNLSWKLCISFPLRWLYCQTCPKNCKPCVARQSSTKGSREDFVEKNHRRDKMAIQLFGFFLTGHTSTRQLPVLVSNNGCVSLRLCSQNGFIAGYESPSRPFVFLLYFSLSVFAQFFSGWL